MNLFRTVLLVASLVFTSVVTLAQPAVLRTPALFGYIHEGLLVALSPSDTLIAVAGDSTGIRDELRGMRIERDPVGEPLAPRNISIYRVAPQPPMKYQESAARVAKVVQPAGGVVQPVFEQGGALLIPSDEVLVGLESGADLAAAEAALKPHVRAMGLGAISQHRKSTFIVKVTNPGNGRALTVSQRLSEVRGVRFAEPNFIVVPIDDGRPPSPPRAWLDILKAPRQPPSRRGQRTSEFKPGIYQTHSSVTWTVLIEESFEGADLPAGWTTGRLAATDPDVYWSITSQRSHDGSRSLHASSGGTQGVAPSGNYPNLVRSWLETPPLDLSSYEEVYAEVWFYGNFHASSDLALIYTRAGAGGAITSFDLLGLGAPLDMVADPTSEAGWRRLLFRVPPVARGNGVQVGVVFGSDDAGGAEGLYIDQLKVVATTEVDTDPISNDRYSARQYELQNAGQIAGLGTYGNDLNVLAAWNAAAPSPQVVVAVIDSGVDLSHPDLRLVPGYDPDGTVGGGARGSHGTAVAGNVGAIGNNGTGVIGVAPGARIMPVFMGLDFADIASAFDVAVAKGARIATNSWGWVGAPSSVISEAVDAALAAGVTVLFAAGNGPDRPPYTYETAFPCNKTAATDVVCVGASSPTDQYKGSASSDGSTFWGSSYIGAGPDVVAPSPWSYTTDLRGTAGYNSGAEIDPADPNSADFTPRFGGTSSATPKVAGVAALMLSVNLDLSPAQVKRILRSTADDIDAAGFDDRTGGGRVNAGGAVAQAALTPGESRAYHLDARANARLASPGNNEAAALVVSVNSSRGHVVGLDTSNFRVHAAQVGPGGCEVEITRVHPTFPGSYRLDLVPFTANPACKWQTGNYLIAILVTNGTYSGAGVADFHVGGCAGGMCSSAIKIEQSTGSIPGRFSGVSITSCPEGYRAISGGFGFADVNVSDPWILIRSSNPGTAMDGKSAWFINFKNQRSQATNLSHYTICVKTG